MIPSLIILCALVVVGAVLRLTHRPDAPGEETPQLAEAASHGPACCGMHITCEKDSLLQGLDDKIVYYDDEELDAYAGRAADAYTDAEIEEFRDVLLTLLPSDIAGWRRSLQLRGIELPEDVRDELLMIVAEARAESAATTA